MKTLLALASLFTATQAFASTPPTLICKSSDGAVLTWNERFGELTVVDKNGISVVDQDALQTGTPLVIETFPSMLVTPIVFGDETPQEKLAEVQERTGLPTQIEMDNQIYICQ